MITSEALPPMPAPTIHVSGGMVGNTMMAYHQLQMEAYGRACYAAGAAKRMEMEKDARRWRHTRRCIRMDNFGGYVIHPDDQADFNGIVAERFTKEVDAMLASESPC